MFQSTHPHGVRPLPREAITSFTCFNPRTRTGCDWVTRDPCIITPVSIHAPARGATRLESRASALREFQSTHPHGVRHPVPDVLLFLSRCFNPRTRTGCDPRKKTKYIQVYIVSIHAPARGATRHPYRLYPHFGVSIHAPARGATGLSITGCVGLIRFNPRTRTGCDSHYS